MSYKVEQVQKEVYENCEKHHLKLVDPDGNEVITQRVSFSNWQLEDGDYEKRVRQWADRRIPEEINLDNIEVVQ